MTPDTPAAADFYASARGVVAALMLRERLGLLWTPAEMCGQAVLGYGYAAPYLRLWRDGARRCVSLTPPRLQASRWPIGAPSLSCIGEEDALPFADLSFDRILLVHGLEAADHARRLLREMWRVLKDDGRLLVVAPNRRGLWAHLDTTPFGQGEPYSPGQLSRLLADSLFRVERRDTALYMPATDARLILRSARLWERAGRSMIPQLAGLILSEAVKDAYAGMPRRAAPRRRLVLMEAA